MLGKTHIALGIASSLALSQPETVSDVVAAMAGGALGGWIVDIDCKKMDTDQEDIYNIIINGLFIGAFIVLDFFLGNGMCQYVMSNWGIPIWVSIACFLILLLIGFNTKHRTFTHSLLAMLLFGMTIYFFCRPAAVPFAIGYMSHLVADIFNKRGLQILFPLKWKPCLNLCVSNKAANRVLFWTALALDVVIGGLFFANAMVNSADSSAFISNVQHTKLFGLNALQLYLLSINVITFLGFQQSWKTTDREILAESDKNLRIALEFETWFLNFLVFIGGGIGMFLSLVIHLCFPPSAYNGTWWAFCYTSILLWFTIYCYACNPFEFIINSINLLSLKHIPLFIYLIVVNAINVLLFYLFRKRHLSECSLVHTLLWSVGALGGTIGGFICAIGIHRENSLNYATMGFSLMTVSQIIFITYMMSVGIL